MTSSASTPTSSSWDRPATNSGAYARTRPSVAMVCADASGSARSRKTRQAKNTDAASRPRMSVARAAAKRFRGRLGRALPGDFVVENGQRVGPVVGHGAPPFGGVGSRVKVYSTPAGTGPSAVTARSRAAVAAAWSAASTAAWSPASPTDSTSSYSRTLSRRAAASLRRDRKPGRRGRPSRRPGRSGRRRPRPRPRPRPGRPGRRRRPAGGGSHRRHDGRPVDACSTTRRRRPSHRACGRAPSTRPRPAAAGSRPGRRRPGPGRPTAGRPGPGRSWTRKASRTRSARSSSGSKRRVGGSVRDGLGDHRRRVDVGRRPAVFLDDGEPVPTGQRADEYPRPAEDLVQGVPQDRRCRAFVRDEPAQVERREPVAEAVAVGPVGQRTRTRRPRRRRGFPRS